MAAGCNSSLPGPPPPPRAVATAIHGGASATSSMAPRWIPKRGQVLRKLFKTVFSCVCIQKESKYPPSIISRKFSANFSRLSS